MDILLTINGEERRVTIQIGETLLEVLRRQGYAGVKHGCEDGSCGVCAVLLDGQVVHSCILLAVQAEGHDITTIEGIGTSRSPAPVADRLCRGWRGAMRLLHPGHDPGG